MPKGIYPRTKIHRVALSLAMKKAWELEKFPNDFDERVSKGRMGKGTGERKIMKGIRNSPSTEFKKGQTPWNKGIKALRGSESPYWKGGIYKSIQRYQQANKEKVRFWWKQKRFRRRNARGRFTFEEWENLKNTSHFICPSCLKKEPEIKLVPDHIIPLSKGGSNYISNIQPLCVSCNSRKFTKIINFKIYATTN